MVLQKPDLFSAGLFLRRVCWPFCYLCLALPGVQLDTMFSPLTIPSVSGCLISAD